MAKNEVNVNNVHAVAFYQLVRLLASEEKNTFLSASRCPPPLGCGLDALCPPTAHGEVDLLLQKRKGNKHISAFNQKWKVEFLHAAFLSTYQHPLQGPFSVSAHCSCFHSSYTPCCPHLRPPTCPQVNIYTTLKKISQHELDNKTLLQGIAIVRTNLLASAKNEQALCCELTGAETVVAFRRHVM